MIETEMQLAANPDKSDLSLEKEIYENIIKKGKKVGDLQNKELFSLKYWRMEPALTGLGGSFMQFYYVVASIIDLHSSEL